MLGGCLVLVADCEAASRHAMQINDREVLIHFTHTHVQPNTHGMLSCSLIILLIHMPATDNSTSSSSSSSCSRSSPPSSTISRSRSRAADPDRRSELWVLGLPKVGTVAVGIRGGLGREVDSHAVHNRCWALQNTKKSKDLDGMCNLLRVNSFAVLWSLASNLCTHNQKQALAPPLSL